MNELTFQEQAFAELYLVSFNAYRSALDAGYAESVARTHACQWVSLTTCPPNKRHLRDYIHDQVIERYGHDAPDSEWLLRRCRLLVDFNIKKFLRRNDDGDMVYDFTEASDDDWYCVEEYVTEQIYRKAAGGGEVPVDKLKIKTGSRAAAIKILGDFAKIAAFRENLNVTGELVSVNMQPEEYKQYRQEMLDADDC